MGFLCILKMYHVRLYIVEKMGFGTTPRRCGIHSKPQPLLQKTRLFHASETLAMYAKMCFCTMLWSTYASCCPRTWADGHFGHLFPKIDFYPFKKLYFPF